MSYSEQKALAGQIVKRCVAQGTKPGTRNHDQCLKVEAQREVVTRRRQAAVENAQRAASRPTVCNQVGYSVICN